MSLPEPYYRHDLALVHHLGYGFHADMCAPGILELLAPVRERGGLVLEIGCGSGLLTRYLVDAGHRVLATDASPAMLELARATVPDAFGIEQLTMPDDPVPPADAVVSIGHPLCYLPDGGSDRPGAARAGAGVAPRWCARGRPRGPRVGGGAGRPSPRRGAVGDDWAIVSRFDVPSPDRFVRDMTTFLRNPDGSWRRDDERHDNVMVDTRRVPALLASAGVDAECARSFGAETLPVGLRAIVGRRVP